MKKLEKKSGRRASRKRERMERLLQEVAPERDGSGLQCPISVREPKRADSDADNLKTSSPQLVDQNQAVSSKQQLAVSTTDSTPTHSPASTIQQESISSRTSARRQRMQRIRKELHQQGVTETSSHPANSDDRTTIANTAADAVRQIANAPKEDDSPTAQSMVAIAGAVTALASAIQFQMTERPEQDRPTPESQRRSSSKSRIPATDSKDTGSKRSQIEAQVNSANIGVNADRIEAEQEASGTESVRNQPVKTRQDSTVSTVSTRQKRLAASPHEALTPAAIIEDISEPEHQNDSGSGFDESFFDDDESDVAGAYTVLPPAEQPVESYRDWFRRVVVRNKWMTWFTAFYVHWLILLFMMMIFVHGPDQAANLLLNGAFADSPEIETESFEMAVAAPEAQPEAKPEAQPSASEPVSDRLTISEMAEESLAISDSLLQQLSDEAAETSEDISSEETTPDQAVKAPPTPEGSVSQGSFSVWTEPEYPDPGDPYRIIVQIQLPPKTNSYHLRDLNGVVVGSDGYRKPIPGPNQGPLPIVDGCVRLVIPIVSADEKVRDTIFIRSKLLKETQKLLIEF
ncbi:MAG: hypothetical protein ABJZ55_06745 [Fuerstiella sp.]